MRISRSALRLAARACALAAALILAPGARAQDLPCLLPGSEPIQTQPICNIEPRVDVNPPSAALGQPTVRVTIAAFDHYSDNKFASFYIVLDGDTVTQQWGVVQADSGGTGTGRGRKFTASGTITLSEADPERTLEVQLCDEQFCTRETRTWTLLRPGVEVGEDGAIHVEPPNAPHTKPFTVRNTGVSAATFALTAECRDALGQPLTPCSVSQASISLAAGATGSVSASYPGTQQGGTVTVVVRARQTDAPGVEDAGWTDVEIRAPGGTAEAAPQVALVPLTAGSAVERSQCVTVATALRGAYECGDLRVAHALPAHRTRGRTWAPVLLYNSQHAHPRPIVYADVTVPATAPVPTSVEMVVTMATGAVHRAVFDGIPFLPGQTRRIGVQWDALGDGTSLYGYDVQVISHYPGGPRAIPPIPGEIAIVNRGWSGFGAGWWLAGVERIICVDCHTGGSRILWVGGDGSTRVYEPPTSGAWTTWVAQNPDGPPDTLVLAGSTYSRKIRGGGRVYFDGGGLHTLTVNRLGQTTRIVHGIYGPTGVYVPGTGAGGPGTGDPAWIINWDGTEVRSISATAAGAPTRTVALTMGTNMRVTAITDPDSGSVAFNYAENATGRRMMGQRDRRGSWTWYGYDNAGRLSIAAMYMGSAPDPAADVVTYFGAAESRGVAFAGATGAASVAAANAATQIDGPRTDVPDVTHLWLTPRGAVRRVRDALGGETYVQFGDSRFPALATRVTTSTGQMTRAHYDSRGRVDTTTVVNVLGDGRDQMTVYAYDNRWDAPTAVTRYGVSGGSWTPLAGTARVEYDTLTGNVRWRQQGDNTARRVNFTYHASGAAAGQLASVRAPSGVTGQTARDSLLYDARGNLRMTVSPLGFLTLHYRDAHGRDTLSITPTTAAGATTESGLLASGVRQLTRYDTMDRVRRMVTIGPALAHNDATGGVVPWATGSDTLYVMTEPDAEGLPLQVLRWASPDTAKVHVLTATYTYDGAGRKVTETDGFVTHRYAYDQTGNVVTWTTPRGHQITSAYDALNRMTRRTVPAVSYARVCPSQTSPCVHPYPYHPNAPNGALVIPEEWTTFRFDSAGSMVYAENADAVIKRSYYPNGALRTDSLAIRPLQRGDSTTHRYGLGYVYDLAGNVFAMEHPQNLGGSQLWDQFAYDPVTGALSSMTDRLGHTFSFHRNFAGQLTSLRGPAYNDSSRYDLEGRLLERREMASVAGMLHHDSLFYDARGKLLRVNVGATDRRGASTYRQWYSGSGMLVATDWQNEMDLGRMQEAFGMDAMGNMAWRRAGDGSSSTGGDSIFRHVYDAGRGRLSEVDKLNLGIPSMDFSPNETTRLYDASGNVDWSVFVEMGDLQDQTYGVKRDKRARSYYSADERLRYFHERDLRAGSQTVKEDGLWEEYRYDPLGRRVLVNTRTANLCRTQTAFQCASATTRMVWAGDQLLWEIRRSSESPGETSGPTDAYGTVSYTHGGGLDRPLVITKNGQSILPHQNWRDQFSRGTYANGASSDCAPGQTSGCQRVAWPGWRTTAWHFEVKEPTISVWFGGLVDDMRDASGQMYKRNRYYDPATGQFTQQDPIGIAGGLNSYGFAAGDPVSYDDPYGLSVCDPPTPECLRDQQAFSLGGGKYRPGQFAGAASMIVKPIAEPLAEHGAVRVQATLGNLTIACAAGAAQGCSQSAEVGNPALGASISAGWLSSSNPTVWGNFGLNKHTSVSVSPNGSVWLNVGGALGGQPFSGTVDVPSGNATAGRIGAANAPVVNDATSVKNPPPVRQAAPRRACAPSGGCATP